jgi:hypothetical protein
MSLSYIASVRSWLSSFSNLSAGIDATLEIFPTLAQGYRHTMADRISSETGSCTRRERPAHISHQYSGCWRNMRAGNSSLPGNGPGVSQALVGIGHQYWLCARGCVCRHPAERAHSLGGPTSQIRSTQYQRPRVGGVFGLQEWQRRAVSLAAHGAQRLNIRVELVPPNPKLFDITTFS